MMKMMMVVMTVMMVMMMMMMMMMRRPSSLRVRAKPRHLPYIYIYPLVEATVLQKRLPTHGSGMGHQSHPIIFDHVLRKV